MRLIILALLVGVGVGAAPEVCAQTNLTVGGFDPNLPLLLLDSTNSIADLKSPCTVQLLCPKGAACGPTNLMSAEVKLHGGVSRGMAKHSYAFSLEEPEQLAGLRTHTSWVLIAAYIDRSLMRHKLSYDLFRSLSTPEQKRYAVGSQFVEVYLNHKYNGVYLLMERVDKSLLQLRSYNSNDASHACIYKAVDHAANFGAPGHRGYEQRDPNPLTQAYWQPLDELNRFVSRAKAEQLWDPTNGLASRLDLDNAIDFHLLVLLTSNSDGITKNFIIARNGLAAGKNTQRFFFVPWDYDGTFGRNWDANLFPPDVWLSNNLFERLLRNEGYREKFVARWNYLKEHQFSVKNIHSLIDQNVRTLGPAAQRNAAKWPTSYGYPDQADFAQDVAHMKSWTEAHVKWLDEEINKGVPARYK